MRVQHNHDMFLVWCPIHQWIDICLSAWFVMGSDGQLTCSRTHGTTVGDKACNRQKGLPGGRCENTAPELYTKHGCVTYFRRISRLGLVQTHVVSCKILLSVDYLHKTAKLGMLI